MPKKRELISFDCGEIVGLHKEDISQRKIAEMLGHPKSTIWGCNKKI